MTSCRRLDLTSALFLDLHHPVSALSPWSSLTTGVPAPLREDRNADRIATAIAAAQRTDAGVVARSTLHALIDIVTLLPRPGDVVAVDEAAYPVIGLAATPAWHRGVSVGTYRHHDPATLPVPRSGGRLFVLTGGWCSGCNKPAPIMALRTAAARTGGLLTIDDSLACGVLGFRRPGEVFGDGSGTVRWCGTDHDGVLWVASFAKAYGTPIAVVTGPLETIDTLRRNGNRLHSSPPSAADLAAGVRAIDLHAVLRRRRAVVCSQVLSLRKWLAAHGRPPLGLPFPVVSLPMSSRQAHEWWKRLQTDGIDTIVQHPACRPGALLSLAIRFDHTPDDMVRLVEAIRRIDSEVAA